MFCQAFRFLAGKMNDCPMFGRSEVSSPHYSLVKLSQRSEMYEVGSFTESEIMNLLASAQWEYTLLMTEHGIEILAK